MATMAPSASLTARARATTAGRASVCCCRCGLGLFPFDGKDPALLTLPLYWGGKRVFKKTALRLTVVQDMASSPVFDDKYSKSDPAEPEVLQKHKVLVEMIPPMYPDRDVAVTHVVRGAV